MIYVHAWNAEKIRKIKRGIGIVKQDERTKENGNSVDLQVRKQWDTEIGSEDRYIGI